MKQNTSVSVDRSDQGRRPTVDRRTSGFKGRQEALLTAPQVIAAMLDSAIHVGMTASYVLMDSWFIHAPLIQEVLNRGLHVISMVKNDNKHILHARV